VGWMRMMGAESVQYHRATVLGRVDDYPGRARHGGPGRRGRKLMAAVDVWAGPFRLCPDSFHQVGPSGQALRTSRPRRSRRPGQLLHQPISARSDRRRHRGGQNRGRACGRRGPGPHQVHCRVPGQPLGGCRGLYVAIATALGATPRFHKAEAINQAAALLGAEEHERHQRVILLIDEAHLLSPEQLEEVRLLSNAELDSASPFAGSCSASPPWQRGCARACSPPWTNA